MTGSQQGRRWSASEDEVLRLHFAERGAKWCQRLLPGRRLTQIYGRVHVLKLGRGRRSNAGATTRRRNEDGEVVRAAAPWTPPPGYMDIIRAWNAVVRASRAAVCRS